MENTLISVALTSYNGVEFIAAQLDSILNQCLPVGEIVVCDDVSTDGTWDILCRYQQQFPGVVKIFRNESNLGCYRNFENALRHCCGEYIFLSDQDDIWLPEKTVRLTELLDKNPECDGVFCDSAAVDRDLRQLGFSFWEMRGFSRRSQQIAAVDALKVMLKKVPVAAHSVALRRSALKYLLPFPELPGFYPDTYLALALAVHSKWVLTPEKLTLYRVHENNATAPQMSGFAEQMRRSRQVRAHDGITRTAHLGRVLLEQVPEGISTHKIRLLRDFVGHYAVRADYSGNFFCRLGQIAGEIGRGRYFRFSNGVKSIAADTFFRKAASAEKK